MIGWPRCLACIRRVQRSQRLPGGNHARVTGTRLFWNCHETKILRPLAVGWRIVARDVSVLGRAAGCHQIQSRPRDRFRVVRPAVDDLRVGDVAVLSVAIALEEFERPYFMTLLVASLPFLWVGTILTVRRLRSLGWKPGWVLLFFVPIVKLVFFAVLCILPSRGEPSPCEHQSRWVNRFGAIVPRGKWRSAFAAILITAPITVLAAWGGIAVFHDYGWAIFVGLPFFMGFLAALIDGFHEQRSLLRCLAVANCTVVLVAAGLVVFAIEGVICLIMAAPLACRCFGRWRAGVWRAAGFPLSGRVAETVLLADYSPAAGDGP